MKHPRLSPPVQSVPVSGSGYLFEMHTFSDTLNPGNLARRTKAANLRANRKRLDQDASAATAASLIKSRHATG
jgi:hypothetical protein